MKRWLMSGMLLMASLTAQPAFEHVAGELLVKFRDGRTQKLLRLHDKSAMHAAMRALSLDPNVEYVEPNYIVEALATPNDPMFARQWALKNTGQDNGLVSADIDVSSAWETTQGTKAFVIGIVDSGIDYNHPDLKANMWSAPREFTVTFGPDDSITCPAGSHGYNFIDNSCDAKANSPHGTMVAGAIGAAGNNGSGVTGVNWTASIMSLAFIDSTGRGSIANALRAIEFAIQAKLAFGAAANVRILNNSWGGSGFSQALLDGIQKANAAGMLFVAGAGNTPRDLDTNPQYPAAYTTAANLITVAATDNRDALAAFSAYGAKSTHVGAPGASIVTTYPDGQYVSASGTSLSTPLVAGIAGLILAACPSLDVAGLRKALLDNADPVPGLAGKTTTGARANAYRSVRSCAVPPGFSISVEGGSIVLNPGTSVSVPVRVIATGGFTDPVSLAIAGLPTGVGAVFTPGSVLAGGAAMLTIAAGAGAPASPMTAVFVHGASGSLAGIANFSIKVTTD